MGIGTAHADGYRKTDASIAKMPSEHEQEQMRKADRVTRGLFDPFPPLIKEAPTANADLPKKGK